MDVSLPLVTFTLAMVVLFSALYVGSREEG